MATPGGSTTRATPTYLSVIPKNASSLFCHELDLHFRCMERAFFERVIDAWNKAGLDAHIVREE